jgi:hypothetical protein
VFASIGTYQTQQPPYPGKLDEQRHRTKLFQINENHINIFWDFEKMSEKIRMAERIGNRERYCSLQHNEIFLCSRSVLFTLKCKQNPVVRVM